MDKGALNLMWFRFEKDFNFSPDAKGGRVSIAYKAGMVQNVTRECAEKAKAAGVGAPTVAEKSQEQTRQRGDAEEGRAALNA
jgi:hypothetical protein